MLTKRTFVLSAISALATLSLTGCSTSHEDKVREFFAAVDAGDIDDAADMYDPKLHDALGSGKVRAHVTDASRRFAKNGHIESVVVETVNADEVDATVRVLILFQNGKKDQERLKLVKVKGTWYVTG